MANEKKDNEVKGSAVSDRVRTTEAQDAGETVVTFSLGNEQCALPITEVHQIIRDVPITRVPNVGEHVEGVINLRGIVVPIVDLKHHLGLGIRELGHQHRLLIVDHEGRRVGFSVDAIEGVFQFGKDRVQRAPDAVLAKVRGRYVRGVVPRGESIVVLLDLPTILALSEGARRSSGWSPGEHAAAKATEATPGNPDVGSVVES